MKIEPESGTEKRIQKNRKEDRRWQRNWAYLRKFLYSIIKQRYTSNKRQEKEVGSPEVVLNDYNHMLSNSLHRCSGMQHIGKQDPAAGGRKWTHFMRKLRSKIKTAILTTQPEMRRPDTTTSSMSSHFHCRMPSSFTSPHTAVLVMNMVMMMTCLEMGT